MTVPRLRIATRGSPLALTQAEAVAARLGGDAQLVVIHTEGDRRADVPLAEIGGRGIFTSEVQRSLLDGRADVAVHSAKDLPASAENMTPGLELVAVPERADPRDCLVGAALADLAAGARVGTGSARRLALLANIRPDLCFVGLRGNIATRLARVGELDAVVVAVAALERLNLTDRIGEVLDVEVVVPQVGQGALAVECRADDADTRSRLVAIDDVGAHAALRAERAFLAALGGGCDAAMGAHAEASDSALSLNAVIASPDGRIVLRHRGTGTDPEQLGRDVARYLVERAGGAALLSIGS